MPQSHEVRAPGALILERISTCNVGGDADPCMSASNHVVGLRDNSNSDPSALRREQTFCHFPYEEAFSRNIGWLTEWEQQALRQKTIAIAGMGGVGGIHLLTLARLGIGRFHIADFDRFEIGNFNRQVGAMQSTLGRLKTDVLTEMVADINPDVKIRSFPNGLLPENIDSFLDDVDLFIDGLDFFALDARARVFSRCDARRIPAITAAPIGMGAAYLVFKPGGMSFERYFRLRGRPPQEQLINFLIGLTPRAFQRAYLMDPTCVSLTQGRGPSTSIACQICAGVASAEAVKILLKRGTVLAAPHYHQLDAYKMTWATGWLPGGNLNPLQIIRRAIARRTAARLADIPARAEVNVSAPLIERILDSARWAPSGDNIQPWRFAIIGDNRIRIDIVQRNSSDVYEFDNGRPTLLSVGFLLECLRIAATQFGRAMHWLAIKTQDGSIDVDVTFTAAPSVQKDPLLPMLGARSVDRRRYHVTSLNREQKAALAAALGSGLEVRWFESLRDRWHMAQLNALATDIRLRIPEAFEVHREILDWQRDFSPTGVPVRAVGLNPISVAAMRMLMRRWSFMDFANRYLGTTWLSKLELDVIPGLSCAAHFAVVTAQRPTDDPVDATLRQGQALQRFWLTATALGLVLQPSLATVCFASYGAQDSAFTSHADVLPKAKTLAAKLLQIVPEGPRALAFMGRIGSPVSRRIRARSVRRPLSDLIIARQP